MKNLAMTSLITFGFMMIEIVNSVKFSYTAFMIAVSFSFGVVGYGGIFVRYGLNIIHVDERHQLITLT